MTLEPSGPLGPRTSQTNGHASIPSSTASSTSSSRPGFSSRLMTTSEIAKDSSLLQDLKQLVNDAYRGAHYKLEESLGVPHHSYFTGLRFRSDTQFVDELPPKDSLVALMFEDGSALQNYDKETTHLSSGSNSANGTRDKLVAIASVKKWKGSVAQRHWRAVRAASSDGRIEKDIAARYDTAQDTQVDPQSDLYHEWEIATCASLDEAKYRGMGFISHLNARLLTHLQDRLGQHATDAVNGKPIRLWVSALGGTINKDYWIKRGYTVVKGADTIPPGVWGNIQDVQVWTLNKVIK